MFRYNLLLFFRHFKRNKVSFLVNLIGLSTGLMCAILIYLWISQELNMDKFHVNDGQLYQVLHNYSYSKKDFIYTSEETPGPLAQALKEEIPEIKYAVPVIPPSWFGDKGIISYSKNYLRVNAQFVGEDYFKMFSYPLINGNSENLFRNKNSVIISEEIARKLFSTTENAMGKELEWDKKQFNRQFGGLFIVSGVFKNLPSNTSGQFDMIFNYDYFFDIFRKNLQHWGNSNPITYVVLKSGVGLKALNNKIAPFLKNKDHHLEESTLFLRKYSNKYLYNNYENGIQVGGRIQYVRLFSLIAVIILILACINFTNLSTARSSLRMKEVSVKKIVGASQKELIIQYLTESVLMALLSLVVALILVETFLPQFNQLMGKQVSIEYEKSKIPTILIITIFTGLISGSYPAFYLSSFKPTVLLQRKQNKFWGVLLARKGLVIFQFTISIIFIVSVVVIYKQMELIQSKNPGYDRKNIIHLNNEGKLASSVGSFLFEVKKIPGVVNATNSFNSIVSNTSHTTSLLWKNKEPDELITFSIFDVNYDFIETFDIKLIKGRSFSKEFRNETSKIIFNEAAIRNMKLSDPIGKIINLYNKQDLQIIGVVENFCFKSFYEDIGPCFIKLMPEDKNYSKNIWIKLKEGEETETINSLKKLYSQFNPGFPFEYSYLDKSYNALYESERRVAILFRFFTIIAIIISCLGLFALATFTAHSRYKEVGIRKVLGASRYRIFSLLSIDFIGLIIISIAISLPVSYFVLKAWLNEFAYRIDLKFVYFIVSGFIALFIAWLTVGIQTVRMITVNPTECLKYE